MINQTDTTLLLSKIASLPEDMKAQVSDFIDFLVSKAPKKDTQKKERVFGSMKGLITMMPDFDAPLEDFKEYM